MLAQLQYVVEVADILYLSLSLIFTLPPVHPWQLTPETLSTQFLSHQEEAEVWGCGAASVLQDWGY